MTETKQKLVYEPGEQNPVKPPDFINLYARQVRNMPEGWRWFSWDCNDKKIPKGFIKIEGAVSPSGKWKRRVIGSETSFLINHGELERWQNEYAKSQGKCVACWNSGLVFAGWHCSGRVTYRPCTKCSKSKGGV